MARCILLVFTLALQLVAAGARADPRRAVERLDYYANPTAATEADLARDLREIPADLADAEAPGSEVPPAALAELRRRADRFRAFAAGGRRITLATSQDPALVALRERVGLAPPSGFAFVRAGLDPRAYGAANPDVRGLTVPFRYIILRPQVAIDPARGTGAGPDRSVLSHELVHAYLNAILGTRQSGLPIWFHEGAALFFADNRAEEVIEIRTPDGANLRRSTLPEDYRQYRMVFDYLRHIRGEAAFQRFVVRSVADAGVDRSLPELVGAPAPAFPRLVAAAESRDLQLKLLWASALAWVILAVAFAHWLSELRRAARRLALYPGAEAVGVGAILYTPRSYRRARFRAGLYLLTLVAWAAAMVLWPVTRTLL